MSVCCDQEGHMTHVWVGKGRKRNTFESNWCQTPCNVKRQVNLGVHSAHSLLIFLVEMAQVATLTFILIQRHFSKVIL